MRTAGHGATGVEKGRLAAEGGSYVAGNKAGRGDG